MRKHRATLAAWHVRARALVRRRPGRLELISELTGYAFVVAAAYTVALWLGLLATGITLVWLANARES